MCFNSIHFILLVDEYAVYQQINTQQKNNSKNFLLEKVVKNYEVAKVVKDIFQILSWFYSVKQGSFRPIKTSFPSLLNNKTSHSYRCNSKLTPGVSFATVLQQYCNGTLGIILQCVKILTRKPHNFKIINSCSQKCGFKLILKSISKFSKISK